MAWKAEDTNRLITVVATGLLVQWIWSRWFASSLDHKIENSNFASPWLHYERYKPGVEGIKQTLAAMKLLVRKSVRDPFVRATAARIVSKCRGHDFSCEVQALFEFVRDKITYRRDPAGIEWVQDARRTIQLGYADCDCKTVLLASLLATLGHKTRFVVTGKEGRFTHVYLEILLGTKWVAADPTNERASLGWQQPDATQKAYYAN